MYSTLVARKGKLPGAFGTYRTREAGTYSTDLLEDLDDRVLRNACPDLLREEVNSGPGPGVVTLFFMGFPASSSYPTKK